jgi:NAD+ synthase
MNFGGHVLVLDADHTISSVSDWIRREVVRTLHRRGVTIGLSGGIDSSVCAALCVTAVGKENVLGLLMPERGVGSESLRLGSLVAQKLGIQTVKEDISKILEMTGCYERQLEAVREVVPDFEHGWRFKLTLPSVLKGSRLPVSSVVVENGAGQILQKRLSSHSYRKLMAATNFKQRVRKMMEYYHADRLHYAVCGTPNRVEYDLGFFVKNGDGSADVKPISHLYKTQVFQLASSLGIPDEISKKTPTTDTFSLPQTQDEFYFGVPYQQMDLCLYAVNHGVPANEVAPVLGLTEEQVQRVFEDIHSKRRATQYLHLNSLLVEPVADTDSQG